MHMDGDGGAETGTHIHLPEFGEHGGKDRLLDLGRAQRFAALLAQGGAQHVADGIVALRHRQPLEQSLQLGIVTQFLERARHRLAGGRAIIQVVEILQVQRHQIEPTVVGDQTVGYVFGQVHVCRAVGILKLGFFLFVRRSAALRQISQRGLSRLRLIKAERRLAHDLRDLTHTVGILGVLHQRRENGLLPGGGGGLDFRRAPALGQQAVKVRRLGLGQVVRLGGLGLDGGEGRKDCFQAEPTGLMRTAQGLRLTELLLIGLGLRGGLVRLLVGVALGDRLLQGGVQRLQHLKFAGGQGFERIRLDAHDAVGLLDQFLQLGVLGQILVFLDGRLHAFRRRCRVHHRDVLHVAQHPLRCLASGLLGRVNSFGLGSVVFPLL